MIVKAHDHLRGKGICLEHELGYLRKGADLHRGVHCEP